MIFLYSLTFTVIRLQMEIFIAFLFKSLRRRSTRRNNLDFQII
jgi:hypothetical protein